uniref:Putative secreted protein n=1 Tax=Anopheles marajoara TaxID=58244 RepID=A0A2M4C9V0_9DIPT
MLLITISAFVSWPIVLMVNSDIPGPCISCNATTAFFGVSHFRRRRICRALRSFSVFLRSPAVAGFLQNTIFLNLFPTPSAWQSRDELLSPALIVSTVSIF